MTKRSIPEACFKCRGISIFFLETERRMWSYREFSEYHRRFHAGVKR